MSTGAVVNPPTAGDGGGGGVIGVTTPTGQGTRPLTSDAVFRIEVSLSSRKSSAIVMKTSARLYSLEGAVPAIPGASPGKDGEWKPVAYGAPCIQLMRESTAQNSPFIMKIVIAEVESGISLWELDVDKSCQYNAMQKNFHTFTVNGKTYAIQFANENEAERMLESVFDLFEQKVKAETVSFDKKPVEPIFKKPKSIRKLNKKDISTPCNFKHVSGITLQRTQTCEDELRGSIQRKMRSMSLSSLSHRKMRQKQAEEAGKMAAINGPVVAAADAGSGISDREFKGLDISPMIARKVAGKGSKPGRSNSILHKFGSLRLSKKKPYSEVALKGENDQPDAKIDGQFVRNKNRMSLPSHFRKQARPTLSGDLFDDQSSPVSDQNAPPVKPLSRSSDNLAESNAANQVPSPTRKAATLERRHTFVGPTSPSRKTPGGAVQFNYTPYSKSLAAGSPQHQAATPHQQFQQFQYHQKSQQANGSVPYYLGKSATLGTHSAQHFHQQMKGYSAMHQSGGGAVGGGVGGVVNSQNTNLASSTGRLHMSDMGLHRTGVTGQTGYHTAQNPSGYVPHQGPTRRLSANEMYQMSMDGQGMMPQKGNRLSSSGGIPVQPASQPVQQVQPGQRPPVSLGSFQYHTHPQILQGGHPHPQMVLPTSSVAVTAPPTSSVMMTTPSTGPPSGYYPPTAQEVGYSVPPGVTSTPQQQPYPLPSTAGGYSGQGNFPSGPVSISGPTVLPKSVTQVTMHSGTMVKGSPVPYAASKGAQAIVTRQSGQAGSPGVRGRVGKDGTSVLSKVRMSPMRQASLSRSGGGGGGSRPRDVVTSQAPVSTHYDQLPQQRPTASHNMPSQQYSVSYSGNLPPQYSAAPMSVAPPSTKYTNVQLNQQYHQQYLQMQEQPQQGSSTTPYQSQSSSTRPYYLEHAHQKQQHHQAPPPVAKKSPPKVANKSPPKHHQTLVSTHMNGSPHNQVASMQSHDQSLSKPQSQLQPQRQHYQQPNNVASQSQGYVPTGKSLPHGVVHVNNTSLTENRHNLVPRPNQDSQFQPRSTQAYDTLPNGNDSLSNINLDALDMNGSLASVTDELDRFTEEMSRALEQFDSLLQPQNSKPPT